MSDLVSKISRKETTSCVSIPAGLKLSQYTIIIDDYPENGKHLLFSTFTHAMVSIDDDLKDLIHNFEHPLDESDLEDIGALQEKYILVDRGLDETKVARRWYNMFKNDMSRVNATILTTYDCNFACRYCIEEGVRNPVHMDDVCSDVLADWLINRARENGTKKISLSFYGGEPLLNTRPICRISERLHRFAADEGVHLSSSITTNGSLLNAELLRDLAKYGLSSVKITIDGERETHDARRPFRSGRGSFDVIIENIQKVPDDVKLIIQTNLDSENVADFPHLLDFLEGAGLKDRIHDLIIGPVSQSIGSTSIPTVQKANCAGLSDLQIADDLIRMGKLAVKRGFSSRSVSINHILCSMNRGGSILMIDPLGAIYNCPALVGREGFSIGDVCHAELNRSGDFSPDQLEECFRCTYFPLCGGGCRYNAYMLYSDHNRIFCNKEIIEHRTKELVKFGYNQKTRQVVNV